MITEGSRINEDKADPLLIEAAQDICTYLPEKLQRVKNDSQINTCTKSTTPISKQTCGIALLKGRKGSFDNFWISTICILPAKERMFYK